MEYGIWNKKYGILNMESGILNLESGILNMKYGIWNMEYGRAHHGDLLSLPRQNLTLFFIWTQNILTKFINSAFKG